MNRQLLQILQVFFRRKVFIVGIFLAIFIPVVIGALSRPPLYQAKGHLMVTSDRVYFRLSPGEPRQPQPPDVRAINTEVVNLTGDYFLTQVAERLPFSLAQQNGDGLSAAVDPTGHDRSPAARSVPQLRRFLEVAPVPNSSLIEVVYKDSDSQRAATVVNTVLETYPTHHVSLYQDPASLKFYDGQKAMLEQEVRALVSALHAYEKREKIFGWPEPQAQLLTLIEHTRKRLEGSNLDVNQGHGKIGAIEQELVGEPETLINSRELVNPEGRLLRERLATLEIEKTSLLQRYTEKDRQVQDKIGEINALKAHLAASERKNIVVTERVELNKVYTDLLRERSEQKVKLGQIHAKRKKLADQLENLVAELEVLNAKGREIERMQGELVDKKELLAIYSKKAEEARIAAALDKEKLVNVKVVDYAQAPLQPVATGALILILLAAIVGLGTGLGGALALEYVRPTFHSVLDVESRLGLPVLALLPDLREQE